jgi:hypothetical protein
VNSHRNAHNHSHANTHKQSHKHTLIRPKHFGGRTRIHSRLNATQHHINNTHVHTHTIIEHSHLFNPLTQTNTFTPHVKLVKCTTEARITGFNRNSIDCIMQFLAKWLSMKTFEYRPTPPTHSTNRAFACIFQQTGPTLYSSEKLRRTSRC